MIDNAGAVTLTDVSCGGTAWNAALAAPALSALAGLISGFVFAGMVVLLIERHQQSAVVRIPALIQFFAAFVALGLNSYMFGLISGEAEHACRRIWTATAISSGMLAAGTVAAVGGVVLLVHAYLAGEKQIDGTDGGKPVAGTQFTMLTTLLRGAFLLIAWMTGLLLLARVGEALWVWLGKEFVKVVPILIIGGLVTVFTAIAYRRLKLPRTREPDDPHVRQLYFGATATVVYSVLGTVVVGALLSVVNGDWSKADSWMVWLMALPAGLPAYAIVMFYRGVDGLIRSWSVPVSATPQPQPTTPGSRPA